MAITCGFFDSVNGDRTYDADQMSTYFEGLISDGVYENIGDRFVVSSANNGMNINVGSGRAIIQSHWVKNDATAVLTLDPSDVQLNRVDAVVLRLDASAREIDLTIKKGTAVSGTPTIPAITRSGTVYELYLASVYVAKGATQPTTITDLRPSSYCGWVTGIIQQVDTSDLFTQWQAAYQQQFAAFDAYIAAKQEAFDTWFSNLTKTLNVDTSITKYEYTHTFTVASAGFQIRPADYEFVYGEDVLLLFTNGVFFVEGTDYRVINAEPYYAIERLPVGKTFKAGDVVTCVILKNVIGKEVTNVDTAVPALYGTAYSVVGQAQRATTVIDMMEYEWETGSGNTNTGAFDNDLSTRLRCNTFIPVPPARSSAILSAFANNAVGLESVIYWYAAASDASYLGYHAWAVNGTELPMPSTAQFFRLNLKIDNETDMVPADLASCAVTFLS